MKVSTLKTLDEYLVLNISVVVKGLKIGAITEGQAVEMLTTCIGVTREEALAIIRGEE